MLSYPRLSSILYSDYTALTDTILFSATPLPFILANVPFDQQSCHQTTWPNLFVTWLVVDHEPLPISQLNHNRNKLHSSVTESTTLQGHTTNYLCKEYSCQIKVTESLLDSGSGSGSSSAFKFLPFYSILFHSILCYSVLFCS